MNDYTRCYRCGRRMDQIGRYDYICLCCGVMSPGAGKAGPLNVPRKIPSLEEEAAEAEAEFGVEASPEDPEKKEDTEEREEP